MPMQPRVKVEPKKIIEISGENLTIPSVAAVARDKVLVQLSRAPEIKKKILASRQLLEEKIASGEIIYGVNTGLGGNVRFILPAKDLAAHQQNIFRFLICGTGNPLPEDAVRAAMLLRANALAKGYSGVRPLVIERVIDLLNHDIIPVVPAYGSVGASGDLIPSAYIGRVLLGQGDVVFKGRQMPAAAALRQARVRTLSLEPKEGLALINGTTMMTGIAALQLYDGAHLCRLVLAACALALEALKCTDDPLQEPIHATKNHPGQLEAAFLCRKLIEGSRYIRNLDDLRQRVGRSHQPADRGISRSEEAIQPAYSLRCIPQGIGPVLEGLEAHRAVIEREINSTNDNPLVDPIAGRIYHTGNFYGGHVARALDSWKVDVATLGNWLHALMATVVDDKFSNGLPPNLALRPGLFAGFKGMQLSLTSLVCSLRHLANPNLIHSLPTEQYNQDIVSLGMHSAVTTLQMTTMLRDAIAIVLITLCQAVDLRGGGAGLGNGSRRVYEAVREKVPFLDEDRPMDEDIRRVTELIQNRLISLN